MLSPIVVIAHSSNMREILCSILEEAGYMVEAMVSGWDAIENDSFLYQTTDLIIVDIVSESAASDLAFVRWLRQNDYKMSILVYTNDTSIEHDLPDSAVVVADKPLTIDEILEPVQRLTRS